MSSKYLRDDVSDRLPPELKIAPGNPGCGPSDKPRLKQLVGLAAWTVIKVTRPI